MKNVNTFKGEHQRANLYEKRETRNIYKPHQQTATTEHQIPAIGQI